MKKLPRNPPRRHRHRGLDHGRDALAVDRRSQPSLMILGSELDDALQDRYPDEPRARKFHRNLNSVTALYMFDNGRAAA